MLILEINLAVKQVGRYFFIINLQISDLTVLLMSFIDADRDDDKDDEDRYTCDNTYHEKGRIYNTSGLNSFNDNCA